MKWLPLLVLLACSPGNEVPRSTITPALLTAGGSTTDQASYSTASITPTANAAVYIGIVVRRSGSTPSEPTTVTGCGLTWVQAGSSTVFAASNVRRVVVFRAQGAAPSTGALTINFPETEAAVSWVVVECPDAETSGTSASGATLQVVNSTPGTGTTATSTLAALEDDSNVHLCFVALNTTAVASADTTFANLGSHGPGENVSIEAQWRSGDTTCDPTYATATPGIISIEVKSLDEAPEEPPPEEEPEEEFGHRPMFVIAGQSNAVGPAHVDDATDTSIDDTYPNVTLVWKLSDGPDDPPAFQEFGPGSLTPRTVSLADGSPLAVGRMGVELKLGRDLDAAIGQHVIAKFAINSSGLNGEWKPSATYPTVGDNLFTQFIAWVEDQATTNDAYVAGLVWIQGNDDANGDPVAAAAYQTNLTAFVTAFRAQFGNVPVVFDRLHVDATGSDVDVVRAQQAAFEADTIICEMVSVDDLLIPDGSHYDADSMVELGARFAEALLGLLDSRWDVTTVGGIRDAQATLIEALTPTTAADVKFRREEGRIDFKEWCKKNPSACLRRFSIMGSFELEGPLVSNTDYEAYRTSVILTVAYPKQFARYGGDNIRDLSDLVHEDTFLIDDTIGHRGQSNFLPGQNFCLRRPEVQIDDGGSVWFATTTYDLEFQRGV